MVVGQKSVLFLWMALIGESKNYLGICIAENHLNSQKLICEWKSKYAMVKDPGRGKVQRLLVLLSHHLIGQTIDIMTSSMTFVMTEYASRESRTGWKLIIFRSNVNDDITFVIVSFIKNLHVWVCDGLDFCTLYMLGMQRRECSSLTISMLPYRLVVRRRCQ